MTSISPTYDLSTPHKKTKGYGSTYIHALPTELLAHIFAQLPPSALHQAQLVCHGWHNLIADEASWRTAFETYYSILDDSGHVVALARRLEPSSWRSEYISRVNLLHRWSKSRAPSLTYNANVGYLSQLHVHFPSLAPPGASSSSTPYILSLSKPPQSLLSYSNPLTGRTHKHLLTPTPLDTITAQPLLPQLGPPTSATLVPASQDPTATGHRVIWGMSDGSLRSALAPSPTSGAGAGGLRVGTERERSEVRVLPNAHEAGSAVLLLSAATVSTNHGTSGANNTHSKMFASLASDRTVSVWRLHEPQPGQTGAQRDRPVFATRMWSGNLPVNCQAGLATVLELGVGTGASSGGDAMIAVAVGFEDGRVVTWPEVTIAAAGSATTVAVPQMVLPLSSTSTAVDTLRFDIVFPQFTSASTLSSPPPSVNLLVHQRGSATFQRVSFTIPSTAAPRVTTFGLSASNNSEIAPSATTAALSAFAFDFAPSPPVSASTTSTSTASSLLLGLSSNARRRANGSKGRPRTKRVVTGFTIHSNGSTPISSIPSTPVTEAEEDRDLDDEDDNDGRRGSTAAFGRTKMVAAGDGKGRTHLWAWDDDGDDVEKAVGKQAKGSYAVRLPRRTIDGASESQVTALAMTGAVILVGSLDGTLRAYDMLTATLLRTFKDRSAPRMPARLLAQGLIPGANGDGSADDDVARWSVSHIRAEREGVVAAVGGRIVSWRVGDGVGAGGKKKRASGTGGLGATMGGRMSARTERFRSDLELRQEVRESLDSLSLEQQDRVLRRGRDQRLEAEFGLPPSLDNMTEEEAVALALMLSVDEQEEQRWMMMQSAEGSPAFGASSAGDGFDLEMEGLSLDEDGIDVSQSGYSSRRRSSTRFEDDSDDEANASDDDDEWQRAPIRSPPTIASALPSPRSHSLSVPTSPNTLHHSGWRGSTLPGSSTSPSSSFGRSNSHTWRPASTHQSPSLAAYSFSDRSSPSSRSHQKIQVSPRLGPTYGSVGGSGGPPEVVPDMSEDLWPTAAAAAPASSRSPPPRSPSAASPATQTPPLPPYNLSGTPVRKGWSNVVSRSVPSPPMGSSSPSTSSSSAPLRPSSLLTAQIRATSEHRHSVGGSDAAMERAQRESRADELRRQEEDELKFALELSLAEERSREESQMGSRGSR